MLASNRDVLEAHGRTETEEDALKLYYKAKKDKYKHQKRVKSKTAELSKQDREQRGEAEAGFRDG